jgi:hypothetical protein
VRMVAGASSTQSALPPRPFGVNAQLPRRITPQFPYVAESDLPYEVLCHAWERLLDSGVHWVRVGHHGDRTAWDNVEVDRGTLRLDPDAEAAIARAALRGVRVQVTLGYGNAMYTGPGWKPRRVIPNVWQGDAGMYHGPKTPEAIDAYAEYCAYMVRRLGGWVKDWEIWNEQNLLDRDGLYNPWGPTVDPEEYTRVLRAASMRIKDLDADARISFGGLAGLGYEFLEACLQRGAGEYIDVVPFHPYRPPTVAGGQGTPEEAMGPEYTGPRYGAQSYLEEVRALQALCDRYRPGLALWANELGWSVPPVEPEPGQSIPHLFHGPVDESTQAKYLLRAYLVNLALGVPTAWWWLLGAPRLGGYGTPFTPDEGLLRPDLSERPAFAALCRMVTVLGERLEGVPVEHVMRLEGSLPALYRFAFRTLDGAILVALWFADVARTDYPAQPVRLRLDGLSLAGLHAIDLLSGKERPVTSEGNTEQTWVTVPIADTPVVLRFPGHRS